MINTFSEENFIEPIMRYYKDFSYAEFILSLPLKSGFKLYLKCIKNIEKDEEEKIKDRIFHVWLIEIQNGYKSDFETYYKSHVKKVETLQMTDNQKKTEEKRILDKIESKKDVKLKKVRFEI